MACDVTRLTEIEAARDATLKAFGRIDILVNNAGITGPNVTTWEYPIGAWHEVMRVNLDSQFYCCRAIVPLMIAQNYGRIVNIASIAGKEGNPNAVAYSASKAGVIALTKSLGKELASYDIAVNCHHAGRGADRDLRPDDAAAHRLHAVENPARPFRRGRGDRGAGRLLRLGRVLVLDRRGVRHLRRAGDLLTDAAHEQRRQRLIGIGLMCGAVAAFACLDCMAKYLGTHMDVMQVVGVRYVSAFLIALMFSNPINRPGLLRTGRPVLQLGRSVLLLGSTVFNFMAFRYLQLDEALAILFSTPFLVAILAGPVLGEWVGWRRWTAIMVGFVGVLVVVRPGLGGLQWAALLSLGSAFCYAGYSITTRMLSTTDSSETTLFYANLFGFVVMVPVLPFVWTPPPSWIDMVLMVAVGVFGAGGHFLLILAHRNAPASVLSPFIYTQIVWATTLRLSGVRQRAQPLDRGRGRDRHRLRPLSAQPRAQGDRQSCPHRARLTK